MESNTQNLYTKYSGVIELTSDDFKMEKNRIIVINKNFKDKYGFIIFYAPWCPHCKNSVEMWSDLAIQFQHRFPIGAVNCEKKKNYEIRNKAKIKYYPTYKTVNKNGTLNNYKGLPQKDELIYYICTKI